MACSTCAGGLKKLGAGFVAKRGADAARCARSISLSNDLYMGINVAIVEDNRSFREKLANYLNETPGYHCVCDCDSAEDAFKLIPRLQPDVVLMDIHLPNLSGVDCTRKLKEICPSV